MPTASRLHSQAALLLSCCVSRTNRPLNTGSTQLPLQIKTQEERSRAQSKKKRRLGAALRTRKKKDHQEEVVNNCRCQREQQGFCSSFSSIRAAQYFSHQKTDMKTLLPVVVPVAFSRLRQERAEAPAMRPGVDGHQAALPVEAM